MLDLLLAPVTIFGQASSWLELLAVVTGLASVWLAARNHVLNWPIGIVNVLLSLVILAEVKLYADATLQIFFAVLCVYGWIHWRGGGIQIPIIRYPRAHFARAICITAAATCGVYLVLSYLTDGRLPVFDASILTLSVLATFLQARRAVESWYVWILVDIISIPVYVSRGLPLFAALYAVFLLLCLFGLSHWLRELTRNAAMKRQAA